jgi:hypothetical protein
MSNEAAVTSTAEPTAGEAPPPFDPDPALVADVENNRFALRSFRKAAQQAHDAAERQRASLP